MTITVPALTLTPAIAERRGTLRMLACAWDALGESYREGVLCAIVHESMDEPLMAPCTCGICLTCTWDAYRGDLALAGDYDAGRISWEDIEPDLTCPDKQGAASDLIWQRVAGLEDVLLRGVAVGR